METTSLWQSVAAHFLPSQVEIQSTTLMTGGFSSAQVVRVATSIGDFALRGTPAAHAGEQSILARHHWQKSIAEAGVPVPVPQQVQTTGQTLLAHDSHLWQLETWLPGESLTGNEITPSQITTMMLQIAKFHQASSNASTAPENSVFACRRDFCPAIQERRQIIHWWTPERLVIASDSLHKAPEEFRFPAGIILTEFLSQAMRLDNELSELENIPFSLIPCPRDLWHAHVLFTGEQVTGLIDLNAARVDHVATDLSRLLGSFFGDDQKRWQQALKEYESVCPLSETEHQLIQVLDRSSVILSGMTWVNRWYHGQVTPAKLDAIVERLQQLTRRISANRNDSNHFLKSDSV